MNAPSRPPSWYRLLDRQARDAFRSAYSGFVIDAMNVQLYAFVLPALLALWHLSTSQAGILASAALLSGSIGGWLAGALSDRIGRIRILRVSILLLAFSTLLCGLARNYEQLLAARLAQGFGFGAEWAVGIVFMSEIAPSAARGRILGTLQSAWGVGWALAAGSTALALTWLPPEPGWRVSFALTLIPALLIFPLRLRLKDAPIFHQSAARQRWHGIFARGLRFDTLKGSLLATGAHGGYWAIATWWPTMLRLERGLSPARAGLHMAALVGGSLGGYGLGAWLNDRIGRRATLASFTLGGLAIVLAITQLPLSDGQLLALTPLLGLFTLGIFSTVGPVLTEIYPTALRGSGLGFCYNMGRALAGLTPLAIGSSMATLGFRHAIGLYVAGAYLIVLLAIALLKETKGVDFASSDVTGSLPA
jgi:MFS family permease